MTAMDKLGKIVELGQLFANKEILITVNEAEKKELTDIILHFGYGVEYATQALIKLNVQTIEYSGVKIHLNIV